MKWCVYCDMDRRTRRDGLCQACAAYRRKYAVLPSAEVLRQRCERRDEERFLAARVDRHCQV